MSKVISFSISDRYLDKIRSLYPELTENLAAKQFLIDQLDKSLYTSLDNNLDDKLRTIEKSLGDRLDASEKSISKWILAFDNRIKDIDQEMKDRSIAIEHQIEKIKIRLNESLDNSLDDSLDDNPDSNLYESYSEIFIDKPDENLDDSLDNELDDAAINKKHGKSIEPDDKWLTLKEILGQRRKDWPKSIEGLRRKAIREGWPRRDRENRKEYQIPVAK
jgi:hypothetical protein